MPTLKHALIGALVFASSPDFATAFEDDDVVDLNEQLVILRAAERTSRESTEAIAAVNGALTDLHVAVPDAVDRIDRLEKAALAARDSAETELTRARIQLTLARLAVSQRLAEIKIEGAEDVEIGGEVRAARMVEAGWERVIDAVTANLVQARKEIARIEEDWCDTCESRKIAGRMGE